jgi:hypothetical protein
MRNVVVAVGMLLVLGACTSAPEQPPPPPRNPPQAAPAPAPPPPPSRLRDQCGAADLQHLVGRPRSEIPVPVDPSRQRVACNSCPVTQDYRADRLNFFFDAASGRITEIRCG